MFKLPKILYGPFDTPSGGGGIESIGKSELGGDDNKGLTLSEKTDFLESDDDEDKAIDLDEKPTKKTKEIPKSEKSDKKDDDEGETEDITDEDDESEEDAELKAIEDELKDDDKPEDEQLGLIAPVRRREILKKYPALFKDFPYLEHAYYREQQFTEVFPDIEDARSAAQDSKILTEFENDLKSGNAENIFKALHAESPLGFHRMVDELLPTLAKVDANAYHHLLGNNIKHTIAAMVKEAKATNNEVLQSAAQILNQFAFGTSEWTPPSKLAKEESKEKNDKESELAKKEQDFNRRQFETARDGVNTRINNSLKATIEANIDPKGSMTDYVKKTAINEVGTTLFKLIGQDKRFSQIIDKLWERSFKANFNRESQDEIRRAYLAKARTLLPSVLKKARIEALKGMGKRVREEKEDDGDEVKETPSRKSTERPRSTVKSGDTKKVPSGMSSLEYLMSD